MDLGGLPGAAPVAPSATLTRGIWPMPHEVETTLASPAANARKIGTARKVRAARLRGVGLRGDGRERRHRLGRPHGLDRLADVGVLSEASAAGASTRRADRASGGPSIWS